MKFRQTEKAPGKSAFGSSESTSVSNSAFGSGGSTKGMHDTHAGNQTGHDLLGHGSGSGVEVGGVTMNHIMDWFGHSTPYYKDP